MNLTVLPVTLHRWQAPALLIFIKLEHLMVLVDNGELNTDHYFNTNQAGPEV